MYYLFYRNAHEDNKEHCFYSLQGGLESTIVFQPVLTLEANACGTLEFLISKHNEAFLNDKLIPMRTEIIVRQDGEEIWSGRILSRSDSFSNLTQFTCEGELGYLNDTTTPPVKYPISNGVSKYLRFLIDNHNSKISKYSANSVNKYFGTGYLAVTGENDNTDTEATAWEVDWNSTMESISDIVGSYGGYLYITKDENRNRFINYVPENLIDKTPKHTFRFGLNLVDFTKNYDWTQFATVLIPLGKELDDDQGRVMVPGIYMAKTSDPNDYSPEHSDAVIANGWIEKIVEWDNIKTSTELLTRAKQYINSADFTELSLEIKGVELYDLGYRDESPIRIMEYVNIVSPPHGLDISLPVTKIEIKLDTPGETTYTLGKNNMGEYTSMTAASVRSSHKDSLS